MVVSLTVYNIFSVKLTLKTGLGVVRGH